MKTDMNEDSGQQHHIVPCSFLCLIETYMCFIERSAVNYGPPSTPMFLPVMDPLLSEINPRMLMVEDRKRLHPLAMPECAHGGSALPLREFLIKLLPVVDPDMPHSGPAYSRGKREVMPMRNIVEIYTIPLWHVWPSG